MIDPTNPEQMKKAVERAIKLDALMTDFRMIIELTSPGNGDMAVKGMLIGDLIGQDDKEWDLFINDFESMVQSLTKKLSSLARDLIIKQIAKDDSKNEVSPDPANMHKKDN